jgi:competence protein ComEA
MVQAAGAVASPGVYRLPLGARVQDVITAAGGPTATANLQAVALAAKVVDGQRVYVPAVGESVTTDAVPAPPPAPLDLNQATVEQLDALPGVGPTTAQAIVDYRSRHGPFTSVDDLLQVRGIGAAKLDGFRDLVTVR